MRFDLTVPFARFMATHLHDLYLPFRRYHFAKVFRGENTQRGRYREFMQCDFDIVGTDSLAADLEILQMMSETLAAIGIHGLSFHINHRGIFNQFLLNAGIGEVSEVLRIVDKLAKIGRDETFRLLSDTLGAGAASKIFDYIQPEENNSATLSKMEALSGGESDDSQRLRSILTLSSGIALDTRLHLNPSITRGLDYYTGIVYETFLNELPGMGSICSGGRYNNLASLYTRAELPGVGSSIGLDRLMAALNELPAGNVPEDALPRPADLLIFMFDERHLGWYTDLARRFRAAGLSTEIYPAPRKLRQQFAYAEKKGIPLGILAGETEIEQNLLNYKNLITREIREGIDIETALNLALAETSPPQSSITSPPEN